MRLGTCRRPGHSQRIAGLRLHRGECEPSRSARSGRAVVAYAAAHDTERSDAVDRVGPLSAATTWGVAGREQPAVNALSYHVRQGLIDGMAAAEASDAAAIVLICDGADSSSPAPTSPSSPSRPSLPAWCPAKRPWRTAANPWWPPSTAPHSAVGWRWRCARALPVAISSAQFGLPEVKLGLRPARRRHGSACRASPGRAGARDHGQAAIPSAPPRRWSAA